MGNGEWGMGSSRRLPGWLLLTLHGLVRRASRLTSSPLLRLVEQASRLPPTSSTQSLGPATYPFSVPHSSAPCSFFTVPTRYPRPSAVFTPAGVAITVWDAPHPPRSALQPATSGARATAGEVRPAAGSVPANDRLARADGGRARPSTRAATDRGRKVSPGGRTASHAAETGQFARRPDLPGVLEAT